MFSGIVEDTGTVRTIEDKDFGKQISIFCALPTAEISIGASIAINGVCLTVVAVKDSLLVFDIVHETLRRTDLGMLTNGSVVNLERSIKAGDRIDGHIVTGHIDATLRLLAKEESGTIKLIFELPEPLSPYLVCKGSVTLSGVSLTVGEVRDKRFSVYVIPHTAQLTTLGQLPVGGLVNLEVDMIARYVVERIKPYVNN